MTCAMYVSVYRPTLTQSIVSLFEYCNHGRLCFAVSDTLYNLHIMAIFSNSRIKSMIDRQDEPCESELMFFPPAIIDNIIFHLPSKSLDGKYQQIH